MIGIHLKDYYRERIDYFYGFRVSISFICSKRYFDLLLHIVGCRPETAEANCSTSKIDDLSLPQINSRGV